MRQSDTLDLRKFIAPESVFGANARNLVGKYALNMGAAKALVVTDPGVRAAGWTDDVLESLHNQRLPYVVFDGVTSNPRAQEVMVGAEVYRSKQCNCIIAVGGGSPIDCAKGIGIVSENPGHILDYEGVDMVRVPIPPIICIPTTGGSSADVSQFAIISDTQRQVKIAIVSKTLVPDLTLIDPVTFTSMPANLTADTGFDALTHAFEAYVSNAHSALTDLFALEAISILSRCLAATISDPMNVEKRFKIAIACIYAGFAFSNAGLGLIHAMSHSLGGFLDVQHGESNAILLPHVISFNFKSVPERYRAIAALFVPDEDRLKSQDVCSILQEQIKNIAASVGITGTLGDMGVKPSDIPKLVANAMTDLDIATNPRKPEAQDIEEIYAEALQR